MHTVTIDISWSRPVYLNGEILTYEVVVTQTSNSSAVVHAENVTDLEVTPSVMVLPFTNYTVTVAAYTSAGRGDDANTTDLSPEAG